MARWAAAALLAGSALAGCAQVDQKINELRYSGSRGAAGSPSSAGSSGSVGSGGAPALQPGPRSASASADAARVLVIINSASSASREIGAYYVRARGIPARNVLSVTTRQTEEIPYEDYKRDIETPLRRALAAANPRIDFVVLTKGLPIRLNHANGNSVDSTIVAMDLERGQGEGPEGMAEKLRNPYFNSSQPFSSARAKMVLVTRLDGYTVGDAKRLVDNSIAARRAPGPFLLDEAASRNAEGYRAMQSTLGAAARLLSSSGFTVTHDQTPEFVSPRTPLAGYAGWGSNDDAFDLAKYRSLRFLPGAIGETFVSTSGRTFLPATGGQSLIADLIAGGITGVKGYVAEPYTVALAVPPILFGRYTKGANLAEAFYAASPVVRWKDVVIGDPLCAPYR